MLNELTDSPTEFNDEHLVRLDPLEYERLCSLE